MYKFLLGLILTGLLGVSTVLAAETPMVMVAVSPDKSVVVTLYDTPCVSPVADLITNPAVLKISKTAKVTLSGTPLAACWMPLMEQGVVAIIMENDESGLVPMEYFVPAEDI